ncbi:MAG: valine--tRNA ligase [Candidatus Brocadiae bacterium]|nr:valine--tRNA ligase [Candidatus Brocadiia bacterium]
MLTELPAGYEPAEVEQRIYRFWEERKLFRTEHDRPGESYTIVIPPPNVTAELHMGHALNNTLQDVFIRFRRMQGYNALWVPGMDHAGIATQNVVERELAKEGLRRQGLGRERFVERVWQWKERYGSRIIDQLKRLGCSCDWDRERFTMDEGLSRAVLETFVRLHEQGLIYRGQYIVNWCPRCRTALSDIESEHQEHDGHLWYILYPLAQSPHEHIAVATTRPETMLGDMAVAVHPKDGRYRNLIGKTLTLPVLGRQIPVIADEWVDRSFGTGAVKVTPAHDANDFMIGRRHGLAEVVVIDEEGKMTAEAGDQYQGMDRFECREALVEDLRARNQLQKVEPYRHSVGHCYRCHTVVEPYLSDQWYVKVKPLAQKAIEAAEDGRVRFHPSRWKDFYLSWLAEARDWCISRQIWWGHRLPVYYCTTCEEPLIAREPPSECSSCGGKEFRRDEDVLDTWFSSALWPFSTLGWPDETEDLKRYYPTDVLVTDRGIIYFWVARMVMMGLEFMDEVPFSDVYIHGTILDEVGRKMSKSLGNGIDPVDMIDAVGADAVRFSLITLATEGQDLKLSESKFEMGRHFANKIWNAARFVLMNLGDGGAGSPPAEVTAFEDLWVLSRLQAVIESVTARLETFRTHEAAQELYGFFWHEVCDWYLEIVKARLQSAPSADRAAARQTLATVLDQSLRLLHPFAPFLTEELWQHLKEAASGASLPAAEAMDGEALITAAWPTSDPDRRNEQVEQEMPVLQDIVRAVRSVRKEKGISDREPVMVTIAAPDEETDGMIERRQGFLKQMAVLAGIEHGVHAAKPRHCATTVVGTIELFLQLEGLIDIEGERQRLDKQRADARRRIEAVEETLHNASFLANAPAEVVEQKKERARELRAQLSKIIQNLADLE